MLRQRDPKRDGNIQKSPLRLASKSSFSRTADKAMFNLGDNSNARHGTAFIVGSRVLGSEDWRQAPNRKSSARSRRCRARIKTRLNDHEAVFTWYGHVYRPLVSARWVTCQPDRCIASVSMLIFVWLLGCVHSDRVILFCCRFRSRDRFSFIWVSHRECPAYAVGCVFPSGFVCSIRA